VSSRSQQELIILTYLFEGTTKRDVASLMY
jgi:hypothetical protein